MLPEEKLLSSITLKLPIVHKQKKIGEFPKAK